VKSRLDGAELIRSRESDKRLTYAPFRLLPDETVSMAAKLSLAFDGIALTHIIGRKSPSGRIIHGREYVRGTVSLGPYYSKVQALIAKIEMQNSNPLPPPLSLNKHCAECEFQPRCVPIAREADDLSLLTKVSVKDREKYRNKGIFTVTQLSYYLPTAPPWRHIAEVRLQFESSRNPKESDPFSELRSAGPFGDSSLL
jgi:predicted RecB family nuclease